jgi:hypothetical protein
MNVLYIEGRCYTFGGVLDLGIIQQLTCDHSCCKVTAWRKVKRGEMGRGRF